MSRINDLSWERHLLSLADEQETVVLTDGLSNVRDLREDGKNVPDLIAVTHCEESEDGTVRKFGAFQIDPKAPADFVEELKAFGDPSPEAKLPVRVWLSEGPFPMIGKAE